MLNLSKLKNMKNKRNICIFIRHAEKNIHDYHLSNEGKKKSLEFAERLYELNKQVNIFSSPEERCIETATIINDRINENRYIYISNMLGKPGVQVKNKIEYKKLTDTIRCRDIFSKWKKGECFESMYTPEVIKEKIINFFKETSLHEGITLYISQSGTVACTGYSLKLVDYNINVDDEWVDYLNGYILTDFF